MRAIRYIYVFVIRLDAPVLLVVNYGKSGSVL
jgi:hypothetical protein